MFTITPSHRPAEPSTNEPPPAAPPPPPATRADRSGAVWVTATGALLLLAAATTFVAVRWEHLHDWQKFGALVVVTQLLLVGGWLGRRRVPATAAATFSLGAVLVPLDAWTIAASGAGDWHRGLFAGGAVGVCALPIARRLFDTSALRWAWTATVPIAVAGTSAWLGLPAPAAIVAAVGLLALSAGRIRDGLSWLVVGATVPLVTLVGPILPVGRGVLADLGLVGPIAAWATAATAVLVVVAVVSNARRISASGPVAVGAALAVADVVAALLSGRAGASAWWIVAALVVLAVEMAARLGAGDPFWAVRTTPLAVVGEATSGVMALGMFGLIAGSGWSWTDPLRWSVAASAAMLALTWLLVDDRLARGRGRRSARALLTGSASAPVAVAVATFVSLSALAAPLSGFERGIAVVASGAAFLLLRRAAGTVVGPLMIAAGTLVGMRVGWWSLGLALVGLTVTAVGARIQRDEHVALLVSAAASMILAADAAWFAFVETTFGSLSPWLLAVLATAGLAAGSVGARRGRTLVAVFPWAVTLVAVAIAATPTVAAPVRITVPAVTLVWLLAEAWWRRELLPALGSALVSPVLSSALLMTAGLHRPGLGVALGIVAVVVVGVALTAGRRTWVGLLPAAVLHLLAGAAVASSDPSSLGVVVTMAGLLMLAVAVVDAAPVLAYNGAVLALLGTWQTLAGEGITTPEWYLAPLAALLLAAGVHARSQRAVSSWIAYTLPILVLGAPALALRLDGGSGWHGVVAGAVAVAAVAVGSWRRLAAPIFLGSTLLVAVTGGETLSRTAGVPTWMWLAAGGCVLLGAGVTMELRGLGPVESGRRVVRLVAERFD